MVSRSRWKKLLTTISTILIAACFQPIAAQSPDFPKVDVQKIRADFDREYKDGTTFMIVSTTAPGLVYIAGIEKSTGEFKVLPADFTKMIEAGINERDPLGRSMPLYAGVPLKFEAYDFVLRNYPECVPCKHGIGSFAQLLLHHRPEDESSFYEPLSTKRGDLRRAYVLSVRSAMQYFPIEEKGPFLTQVENGPAGLNIDETLLLNSCYTQVEGKEEVECRSFWYRPLSSGAAVLQRFDSRGDEQTVKFLKGLVPLSAPPPTLDLADQLIDMGHRGIAIDDEMMTTMYAKARKQG